MAPLFTIHAHLLAMQAMGTPHAEHQHGMSPVHDCCPGFHKSADPGPSLELKADGLPCEEEHRCCFRQGPQSTPSPASDGRRPSPEISENSAQLDADLIVRPSAWSATIPVLRPPPGTFGTVIRI